MRLKEGRLVVLSFLILSHVFGETHGQDRIPFAGDTLNMPSAIVEVLRIPTPIERAPGTLVVFEESQLQNGVSADIEDVINTIPGVKMETRGIGGSRRIQMRSSGLRSPFAVRNIHMLCNGFVLTGAGGTSPVELWNPQWLNRLEVLLGPTGAIFGGGYGGALVATSLAPFDGLSNDLTLKMLSRISTTGRSSEGVVPVSFETGFSASSKGQSKDWSLNATWSENPGYRDQESNQRRNIEFHRRWKPQPHILHHVWTGLLQASWDLPGSITAEQALTAPTTAPGASYDAHVERNRYWLSWSRTATNERAKNGIWAYAQASNKYNPFGTSPFYQGQKEEKEINGSVRWWRGETKALNSNTTFTWDQSAIGRFENVQVDENDLIAAGENPRYAIDSDNQTAWMGSGIRLEVANAWLFDMQWGVELMHRSTTGQFFDQTESVNTYEETYSKINWAPRIGIGYAFDGNQNVSLQYAEGSSHPNTFELVDPETNFFADLNSEQAKTWELSWKGKRIQPNASFHWSFNAYKQTVKDAISTVEGDDDGLYLANVEGLQMKGLEASIQTQYNVSSTASLAFSIHGNINRHEFTSIMDQLPGTPLHVAGATLAYQNQAIQVQWNHIWNDRTPLNDASSSWAAAYQRSDFALSFTKNQSVWRIGMRNALDAQYSNWLQINAFGGKNFNPAPGRTIWASWVWNFSR